VEIFESGAGLLQLAGKSEKLMPRDPVGEAKTVQWMIGALNSIEMVTVPPFDEPRREPLRQA
jgi:glutathione S-transferase